MLVAESNEDATNSSQEPGQARHASRPPSALGSHLDFNVGPTQDTISGSQRSAFFPWDHAGPSSSAGGAPFSIYGSDGLSGRRPASKRASSASSRRESLLFPPGGIIPPSPIELGLRSSQVPEEDFHFDGRTFSPYSHSSRPFDHLASSGGNARRVAAIKRLDP